jgi:predicted DNA-binding protein YlxM (UPF0122 family)
MAMTFDKQTSDIFDKNRAKYLRQINKMKHNHPYKHPYTVWTEDQVEQLTKLWKTDLPTREIAEKLGVTKNAVIGKVKRLGLAMRRNPAVIIADNKLALNAEKPQYLFR